MRLAKYSHPPKSVSSDFGQLAVNRHFSSGIDWAMAGAAIADVASPPPAALRNSRRFMMILPVGPLGLSFFYTTPNSMRRSAFAKHEARSWRSAKEFNIYRRAKTKRIAPSPALRRVD